MRISTHQLSTANTAYEGDRLVLVETPPEFPIYLNLTVHVEDLPVNIDIPGILHLYEHMMFRGYKGMTEDESTRIVYGNFYSGNASTLNNTISLKGYIRSGNPMVRFYDPSIINKINSVDNPFQYVGEWVCSEKSIENDPTLSIFPNMILNPNLKEEDLESEKEVVIREIQERIDYEVCLQRMWSMIMSSLGVRYENEIGTIDFVRSIEIGHLRQLREHLRNYSNRTFVWAQTCHTYGMELQEDELRHKIIYPCIPSFTKGIECGYSNDMVLFIWNINHIVDYDDVTDIQLFINYAYDEANPKSLFNVLRSKGYIYYMGLGVTAVEGNIFLAFDAETSKGKGWDLLKEVEDWNNSGIDPSEEDNFDELWKYSKFIQQKRRFNYDDNAKNAIELYNSGVSLNEDRKMIKSRLNSIGEIKKMMSLVPTYSVVGV